MNVALVRIEAVQLGGRTLESLRAAIISGELPPGEPLRDRQLADMLGVSRTPVREALQRLESAGLVVARGRAGWEVSPFTEQDVHELFQLRRLLEPVGLERLAQEPDEEAIVRIGGFFEDYHRPIPVESYPEYFKRDHAFHKQLIACSGSERIKHFYAVLETHIDRGRHFLTTAAVGRADETLAEHRAVCRAIADLDFVKARSELLHHLSTGEELMKEQLRLWPK